MLDKKTLLKNILLNNFDDLYPSDGGYANFYEAFPHLEVYPRDYIEFAEKDLEHLEDGVVHLINCVGHLKRAVDGQIDIFFHILGIHDIFKKRNLKFDKKLEFLKEIDIVSPRTLSRFNRIRNEIEHEHTLPENIDLELFFDLSVAFISSLELTIALLTHNESNYVISKDEEGLEVESGQYFSIQYNFPNPEIRIWWNIDGDKQNLIANMVDSSSMADISDFAYFLKVFILLQKFEGFCVGNQYIYERI